MIDKTFLTAFIVSFAVVVGLRLRNRLSLITRNPAFGAAPITIPLEVLTSHECSPLPLPMGIEDLAAYGDGHSAFAGGASPALFESFDHGSHSVDDGAVFLVDAAQGRWKQLDIDWNGHAQPKLVLHGLHYSQGTRRLYGVNHDVSEDFGESVEVWEVVGEDAASLSLKHLASVRDPDLFHHYRLNDVVEDGGGEEADAGHIKFFVTEYFAFGLPRRGEKDPVGVGWGRGRGKGGEKILIDATRLDSTRGTRLDSTLHVTN